MPGHGHGHPTTRDPIAQLVEVVLDAEQEQENRVEAARSIAAGLGYRLPRDLIRRVWPVGRPTVEIVDICVDGLARLREQQEIAALEQQHRLPDAPPVEYPE